MKRGILAFVVTCIGGLSLAVPIAVSADGLQAASFACNDGTQLALSLDLATFNSLSLSTTAISTYPTDLACSLAVADPSLTQSDPSGGQHDFAVGGVQYLGPCSSPINLSFSGHVDNEQTTAGVGGTINQSIPEPGDLAGTQCEGKFKAVVTCVSVEGNQAQLKGIVTAATGVYETLLNDTTTLDVNDNGNTQTDTIGQSFGGDPYTCQAEISYNAILINGHITVHDADVATT
ncbi:MAG TPA: hypothetical protein VIT43_10300 [Candidatus Dormibacteraeota bacterium]